MNFNQRFKENNTVKGLPRLDPKRLVHASQTIEVLRPLPLVSEPGWRIKKRLASIRENSAYSLFFLTYRKTLTMSAESGVIIESELTLVDPNGVPYSRLFVRFSQHSSFRPWR